jgi:hypothetical protein
MRTFAQKQNQSQKPVSSNLAWCLTATPWLHHRAGLGQQGQHTIKNQTVKDKLQILAEELNSELTNTAPLHFGHDFGWIPMHVYPKRAMQTKLMINKPGDKYEQVADHIAEQIMRMPELQLQQHHVRPCSGESPRYQAEQGRSKHSQINRVQAVAYLVQTLLPRWQ